VIEVTRDVTRQTSEYDHRTRKPLVIRLVEGGKLVRLKVKGTRRWYTVTVKQIWLQGALNRAAELRAEKKARREARKQREGGR
jgi:hypothetical protein